ncbi:MAG: xanthine dehydrogenase family protein subunit M [Pseudomonadota bacterium]
MRLFPFEYRKPAALEEAIALLSSQDSAKIIAGGTDLLPRIKKKTQTPKTIVSIKALADLNYIREESGGLRIGALTTLRHIEQSPLVREKVPFLAEAARSVGSLQLRYMGTIGGNICQDSRCSYLDHAYLFGKEVWEKCYKRGGECCHAVKAVKKGKKCYAVYSSDIAPVLVTLGAKVKLMGQEGEKSIRIENFFSGQGDRVHRIKSDEIVTEFQIPVLPSLSYGVYLKERDRQSIDYAIAGVAVLFSVGSTYGSGEFRIVLTSVGSSPIEAKEAEVILSGKQLNEDLIDIAGDMASKESHPVSNHNYSAGYLRDIIKGLVKKACLEAGRLARQGGAG